MIPGHIPSQPPSVRLSGFGGQLPFPCPFPSPLGGFDLEGNASFCPVYTPGKECDSGVLQS